MFAVTVVFNLKPGMRDAFLPLMTKNAAASRREESGCQQFDVCVGGDPETIFLYEVYDDRAAFDAHLETAHFKSFNKATSEMIADKVVHFFTGVIR
ncbi:putative quinol monooxygenase [Ruegeria sp. 2205SS24-7]|uniref:putative quinol monooxygenase n=1 Tax=Ruegeria discodermiae TaxID=3064389 RepID=UPI0027425D36|nr:putative quinol monooxygenase [Ruegeria sp. 2205SS24-7]MDP5218933.1 putative quinol monooxygenase [Ruegeria sp. 2205SS24-7]